MTLTLVLATVTMYAVTLSLVLATVTMYAVTLTLVLTTVTMYAVTLSLVLATGGPYNGTNRRKRPHLNLDSNATIALSVTAHMAI